jgi:hypothetical protein
MTTIRNYLNPAEAGLAKSLLEAAGIPAFVADEDSTSSGYGTVLGGVRLQVQDADVERARQILKDQQAGTPLSDDFVPPEPPPPEAAGLETMVCDNKNIFVSVMLALILIFAMIAAFNSRRPAVAASSFSLRAQQEAEERGKRYDELQAAHEQAYEERAKRTDALLASQEQAHERVIKNIEKSEEQQRRYEKILATWEQQQQEYQKYLDGLEKK